MPVIVTPVLLSAENIRSFLQPLTWNGKKYYRQVNARGTDIVYRQKPDYIQCNSGKSRLVCTFPEE